MHVRYIRFIPLMVMVLLLGWTLRPGLASGHSFVAGAATTSIASPTARPAERQPTPVVNAVLFWSQTCPHCHYMAYVETQAVEAVCGPVGDCNAVQNNSYAKLFGVLPVGVLGVVGYAAILAAWFWSHLRTGPTARQAQQAVLAMTRPRQERGWQC